MTTALLTHPSFLLHDTGPGHPERIDRLKTVLKALRGPEFAALLEVEAQQATTSQLLAVHPQHHIDHVLNASPESGLGRIDADTVLSPKSGEAALFAAGAVCQAVDLVMTGKADNAFCAVRPPGHHAEPDQAMGFCLFSNIAIAAHHAQNAYGCQKVAVVDFDVHHGNGTQAAFWEQPDMHFYSTHQAPLYPGTGSPAETGIAGNIHNIELPPMAGGPEFRQAVEDHVIPSLYDLKPDILFLSAGFDAHYLDPLAQLELMDRDFAWISQQMVQVAGQVCGGRLVSALEGGYDLTALENSVSAHVAALMQA